MKPSLLERLLGSFRSPPPPLPPQAAVPPSPQGDAGEESARWAYRLILLREPDSPEALRYVAGLGGHRQMRDALLQSEEARTQAHLPTMLMMTGNEPAQRIDVRVAPAQRDALFAKVQAAWHALGEEQPHWSVVTDEAFRPGSIDRTLEHFYATGEQNVETLARILTRNGIDMSKLSTCMDFGCGVGRLSMALARRFGRVEAVDISASHLAVAREAFAQRGVANVTTHLLEHVDSVASLPAVDLVYSIIVLQHNPPPVILALFEGLLGRIRPGGAAVIQVPTYLPGDYRFAIDEYLAAGSAGMEMHAIPQAEVFDAARRAGVDMLEVLEDAWTGYGLGSRSNTFVMRRPTGGR